MSARSVKDALRHRAPSVAASLVKLRAQVRGRSSPAAALDQAHRVSAMLGPGTEIVIDRDGVWLHDADGCYWKHVAGVYGPFLGLERGVPFEAAELAWARATLPAGGVFVDVGANIGAFSINLLRGTTGTRGVALEPVARTFDSLASNTARNGLADRLTTTHAAVGSEAGEVLMTSGLNAANHVVPRVRSTPSAGEERVRQVTLDDVVAGMATDRVDLLKLDVEGFELNVLAGAEATLARHAPYVLMEVETEWASRYDYDPRRIFDLMDAHGYEHLVFAGELRPGSGDLAADLRAGNNFVFRPRDQSGASSRVATSRTL